MADSSLQSDWHIQEYQSVKERIRDLETRREQAVLLTVTAIAATLGFSGEIPLGLVPPLVAGVLLLSSFSYAQSTILQHMATAYLIERFESRVPGINFETGFHSIVFESPKPAIKRLEWAVIAPYTWLSILSLCIVVIWSRKFLGTEPGASLALYLRGLYLGGIVLAFFLSSYSLHIQQQRHIAFFRAHWRQYLDKQGPVDDSPRSPGSEQLGAFLKAESESTHGAA